MICRKVRHAKTLVVLVPTMSHGLPCCGFIGNSRKESKSLQWDGLFKAGLVHPSGRRQQAAAQQRRCSPPVHWQYGPVNRRWKCLDLQNNLCVFCQLLVKQGATSWRNPCQKRGAAGGGGETGGSAGQWRRPHCCCSCRKTLLLLQTHSHSHKH